MAFFRSVLARRLGIVAALGAVVWYAMATKAQHKRYDVYALVVVVAALAVVAVSYMADGESTNKSAEQALKAAVDDYVLAETGSTYVPVPVWNAARTETLNLVKLGYTQADAVAAGLGVVKSSMPWT